VTSSLVAGDYGIRGDTRNRQYNKVFKKVTIDSSSSISANIADDLKEVMYQKVEKPIIIKKTITHLARPLALFFSTFLQL
jgi:hypothetical protein